MVSGLSSMMLGNRPSHQSFSHPRDTLSAVCVPWAGRHAYIGLRHVPAVRHAPELCLYEEGTVVPLGSAVLMKAENLSGRGAQVFLMRAQEVLQAETGNRPTMTAVVPEERLQERQDSAARQTQHGLEDKMFKDSQQDRPEAAAQQAEHAPEHAGVQQRSNQRESQPAARQAECTPEEDEVAHQERETMPAAQQAQHDASGGSVRTQQPIGQSCTAKGPDAAKPPEEVAHPQKVDGQTFFDAREGEVPSSPTAP